MKILIITQNTPYPLSDGGKIAQFTMIDYLRHKCSITLLLFAHDEADHHSIQSLKNIWNNVVIEVVSVNTFQPLVKQTTYKKFLHFLVTNIDHVKYRLNKLLETGKSKMPVEEITPEGILKYLVSFAEPREKDIINKVVKTIHSIKPDLVQLDFVETLDLSLCIPKEVRKIFVHHEIRFRRIETEIKTVKDSIGSYGEYVQNLCELLEVNLLNNFDGIVTFSEEDKKRLLQKLTVKNILSSPFPVLDREILEIKDENLAINKLVFVGFENHSPNRDAVEWYANSMSKIVHERFGFVLHVIGNWSDEFKRKHANNSAVYFSGFVEDLSGYCKNSIMIVPLRIGSGIRTKILHSMAWGVPVISTTIGSEGIVDKEKIFLTANTADEFVESIDKITGDQGFCKSLVSNAQSILKQHYSQKSAGEKRLLFYKSVLEK